MSQPAFTEFRPYGGPKRLEWLLVQATASKAGARRCSEHRGSAGNNRETNQQQKPIADGGEQGFFRRGQRAVNDPGQCRQAP